MSDLSRELPSSLLASHREAGSGVSGAAAEVRAAVVNRLRRSRAAVRAFEDGFFVAGAIRKAGVRAVLRATRGLVDAGERQRVLRFDVPLPACGSAAELAAALRAEGLVVREGSHALYLPPAENLRRLLPAVVAAYPAGTGFKLLKDLRAPEESRYLGPGHGLRGLARDRLLGRPRDQLVTANYVHALGLGPRCHDVAAWRTGEQTYTAFAVEHVEGGAPSLDASTRFLARLEAAVGEGGLRVLLPRWRRRNEFTPPACNGNLVWSSALGEPRYVDFESFGLDSAAAWSQSLLDGAPLDADDADDAWIPSGRLPRAATASARWHALESTLRTAGIDLDRRVALDVGCGPGLLLHSCLARGASWVGGFGEAKTLPRTERLLYSLGATRFTLGAFGAALSDPSAALPPGAAEALPESVVFCRSPLPPDAAAAVAGWPWRALVVRGRDAAATAEAIASRSHARGARIADLPGSPIGACFRP